MPKNEVKNRVIVETPEGDRAFLLLEGDIFQERADVYVFNSYSGDSGMLMDKLKEQYRQEKIPEMPFYFSKDGTKVGKITLEDGRIILMLHSNLMEHEAISSAQYNSFIENVYTSLTALETIGKRFETVAFPILLRNGISAIYPEAIKILVEKSTRWLKSSENTKAVKYVLYESGDAKLWNENLNAVLGRRAVNIDQSPELYQYKNKVLSILQLLDKKLPYWEDTLLPIRNALQQKEFRPEVVAAFSRKLLEVYCSDLSGATNHFQRLDDYLQYLQKNKLLNIWDVQTLYQIRSFGNPSIHRPTTIIGPQSMDEKDTAILLICLYRLLEMIYESQNRKYPFKLR
ncbi:hypothetical protein L1279_000506 [Planomicrobium sp. HSC-17F08]|nr:hypothetical protein [Planomicrobium sp. HSC-17F08]